MVRLARYYHHIAVQVVAGEQLPPSAQLAVNMERGNCEVQMELVMGYNAVVEGQRVARALFDAGEVGGRNLEEKVARQAMHTAQTGVLEEDGGR